MVANENQHCNQKGERLGVIKNVIAAKIVLVFKKKKKHILKYSGSKH